MKSSNCIAVGLAFISPLILAWAAQAQTYKEAVLYSFAGAPDGANPYAGLVRDAAGNLYGTTVYGGTGNCNLGNPDCGTVFKVTVKGKETVLHSFTGAPDGELPDAGLIFDKAGNLYGTTLNGGAASYGAVFKLDATGDESVLYSFTGTDGDGDYPYAGLVIDGKGNLYGTTAGGGAGTCQINGFNGCGTIFKLKLTP